MSFLDVEDTFQLEMDELVASSLLVLALLGTVVETPVGFACLFGSPSQMKRIHTIHVNMVNNTVSTHVNLTIWSIIVIWLTIVIRLPHL